MQKSVILILTLLSSSVSWSASFDMRPFAPIPLLYYGMINPKVHQSWYDFTQGYCYALMHPTAVDAPEDYSQCQINGFVVARQLEYFATQRNQELPAGFVPVMPVCYGSWHKEAMDVIFAIHARRNKNMFYGSEITFTEYNNLMSKMAAGLFTCQILPSLER